jgi:lipopolysaccharide/colanic/teichoic acid biosynthesis glycosyltransferase
MDARFCEQFALSPRSAAARVVQFDPSTEDVTYSRGKDMNDVDQPMTAAAVCESPGFAPRLRRLRRDLLCRTWLLVGRVRRFAKRALDIAVSLFALAALLPLFAVVALLIWLTDRGPVLYWQERVGRHGRVFRFPKFRSMVMNAEALVEQLSKQNQHGAAGVTFKMRADPRITWIGRIIRRTSIDELPQLWCVLVGDMSLVGPRPALPREVARYTLADRRRLEAVPGLTCHWQVQGRSEIPFPRQVELDVEYIEQGNLGVDIKLLGQTIPAVVTGRGAY